MSQASFCPQCNSENIYHDGMMWICPECSHEWTEAETQQASAEDSTSDATVIKDAHGTPLQSGDTVSVIKDLKVKGSSLVVKSGTKVKNIRLIEAEDGHDIACKIDGIGAMNLKSEFVKKI